MREETALDLAVGLLQLPSRARALREAALPRDMEALLGIIAGEGSALAEAARMSGLTERALCEAAGFYVEQILLHPGADSYRALGAQASATTDELRRNMALLLRWLHPDREANSPRAVYASRVTEAWNNLKTPERRAAYDATRTLAVAVGRDRNSRGAARAPTGVHHGTERKVPVTPPLIRALSGGRQWRGLPGRGRFLRILERLLGQYRI